MRPRSRASKRPEKTRRPKAGLRKGGNAPKATSDRGTEAATKVTDAVRLARELKETREQQVATADVLKVISRSPSDVQPVFDMIAERAQRLCEGQFCFVYRFDGQLLHFVAHHSLTPEVLEMNRRSYPAPPSRRSAAARAILERGFIQVPDINADPDYALGPMSVVGNYRSVIAAPIIRDGLAIGAIAVARAYAGLLPDPQIELLKTFADQAAIAIENARLFEAEQQRTRELSESLERQTATSDVLSIISSSPGELEPVFEAMLAKATHLCAAKFGVLYRFDGVAFHFAAEVGTPPKYREFNQQRGSFQPIPGGQLERVMLTKEVSQIADDAASTSPGIAAKLAGARTQLAVPMLKEGNLIGAIIIYRQEVYPFTDKQISLVENFAAQAVIAIENARLLSELRQRTEEVVKFNQQLEQRVADQVGEIERMGRLRRFLPPQVADLIVASGTEKQLESHRREITALFCDLRGFTGFSESSDPEDVMALLADYHAGIGTIINKYSGTLERYAGDGVMVIFNDPVPVENPALQAVLMALEMRTAIEALMEKWRLLGHDIGFGIGIAHGFATLGTIGFEGRRDYAAIGTVSNVASRLCDEARPGQILISPRVLLAVDKAVTVESVGEFTLKGIRRPMTAYNVLAPASKTT